MYATNENWPVLMGLLPANRKELARSTGAVTRLRGFESLDNLLRTLLMHVGCGWSLRETAVHARLGGVASVSDVTLLNRLRQSEEWLRALCQQLWEENGVDLQPALKGRIVRLVDATSVREPGKTGGIWRIHYSLRLPTLECDYFDLTPSRGKGIGERLGRFTFRPGELVLADAGYSHSKGIAAVAAQGADLCVRVNPASLPLLDGQGQRFSVLEALGTPQPAGMAVEWAVQVQAGDVRVPGRLCAARKSEEAIARAQRRLDVRKQQLKAVGTPETREHANYIIVFTTLPANVATTAQVLECYRLRWQIGLTFKGLKSIAQLGHVPKSDDRSSRAWLYGKLLVALLTQKLARIGRSISPWGYHLVGQAASPQSMA